MTGLENRVALVSAASSGIGRGIARVLASRGCTVHIFSHNEERIRKSAEDIMAETGGEVHYSVGDLSSPDDVRRVMDEVRERYGGIDFLVVNYGDPRVAPFMEITEEDWDSSMNMFVKSSVIMSRAVIPYMAGKGSGRFIFVTSLTTKQPMPGFALSASLRSAVVSLSKVLSIEHSGEGITFNSISQGKFMTPRLESIAKRSADRKGITMEEAFSDMKKDIPAGRFGDPGEIGELVAFLCSSEASYINGTNIQIDGGAAKFPF